MQPEFESFLLALENQNNHQVHLKDGTIKQ